MSVADTSSRGGRIEFTIGLLILATIVGVGVGLAVARNTPVEPGLVIESKELDFGSVWEQPAYQRVFQVKNPTEQPIRVAEIKTGCGCTTVEPRSFTIAPGEAQKVTATLNLFGYGGKPFSVDLRPNIAHQPPESRSVWRLTGRVRANPLELSEPSIDFGRDVMLGEPLPLRELQVSLPAASQFDDLTARVIKGRGEVSLGPSNDGRWRLKVTPPEGLPEGPFSFVVRIEPKAGSLDSLPFRDIGITGTARDDIAAWPDAVNFGVLTLGETGREYVVLASHRGRPFEVTQIETSKGVTVKPAEEQLGDGSRTFVVEHRVTQPSDWKDEVILHLRRGGVSAEKSEEIAIPIQLSCYGTTAEE